MAPVLGAAGSAVVAEDLQDLVQIGTSARTSWYTSGYVYDLPNGWCGKIILSSYT